MRERTVEVGTRDGVMPVFVTHPEEGGPHPAVILYMDALGVREELRDMARRIGTVGYYVALPGLFYRDGNPSFDPALLPTRGPDPEMMRLNMALTHEMVLGDTAALIGCIDGDPAAARGPMGTVGYCMGGRHSYAAAGTFPDRVGAMASLHGGFQVTDRPDSAHLLTPDIRAECYFGFAAKDPVAPPEHQRIIAEACREHGVACRIEVHPGTLHGFTFPERYCYHKEAAERTWERIFALFRRRLG
jgi:carboxymethylenebutenolidase